jgi:YVTN family beta-propeller protein
MRTPLRAVALGAAALGSTLLLGAAPASAATTAVIPVTPCCVGDTLALGGNIYALAQEPPGPGPEQPSLLRIDPSTNQVTGSVALLNGTSSGNAIDTSPMVAAAGSIWVVSYFQNQVLRIDPQAMAVTAQIAVGRSPSSIVYDGRSLWVALNNARSVIRIDPARNLVTRRVRVGSGETSDSPWQLAFDGTRLLASMPVSGRVARINPSTGRVRYDVVGPAAAACAHILPVRGGYWLDDTECGPAYFRWSSSAHRITATVDPTTDVHHDWGAVVRAHALYTGEFDCTDTGCTHGVLVKRDLSTGAVLAERSVGVEALLPHFAAGSFWVADFDDATLQRVRAF